MCRHLFSFLFHFARAGHREGKKKERCRADRVSVWRGFITTDDAFSEKYAINIIFFFFYFKYGVAENKFDVYCEILLLTES